MIPVTTRSSVRPRSTWVVVAGLRNRIWSSIVEVLNNRVSGYQVCQHALGRKSARSSLLAPLARTGEADRLPNYMCYHTQCQVTYTPGVETAGFVPSYGQCALGPR